MFSVVIPAHNAVAYIGDQLDALAHQTFDGPFEVIVVDNRSSDGTADAVLRHAERLPVRVIEAPDGRSASYARNAGVRAARGEYVVFVDADDVADSGLLSAYAREVGRSRILGGRYEEARLNSAKVAAWRYPLTDGDLPVAFRRIPFFLMGNVAIERAVFDKLGFLDEALAHGGEEVDFSCRAHLQDERIAWVPDAVVYYRHRSTLRGLSRQFFDYGRATAYVYARYRHAAGLPPTTRRDVVAALWMLGPHALDLVLGNRRRGGWIRVASFYAGEIVQSLRQRTLHLG